jgi:nitrate reductase NapAB chaperone NapD
MPICSYLIVPAADRTDSVMAELNALAGCEAQRADDHDVIALVTETPGPAEEEALRGALARIDGIFAMVLTFGELESDPVAS